MSVMRGGVMRSQWGSGVADFKEPASFDSYLWANRPAAAAYTGRIIRITDVGPAAGSLFISDGTYWVPLNGSVVLYSGTELGYSTTSTTAVQIADLGPVLKAGLFQKPGSFLRSMARGRRTGTLGTSGFPNIRIGWTGDGGANLVLIGASNTADDSLRNIAVISRIDDTQVRNNNLAGAGGGFAEWRDVYEPNVRTLDATATTNVIVTGQIADTPGSGETIILDELIIELIVP